MIASTNKIHYKTSHFTLLAPWLESTWINDAFCLRCTAVKSKNSNCFYATKTTFRGCQFYSPVPTSVEYKANWSLCSLSDSEILRLDSCVFFIFYCGMSELTTLAEPAMTLLFQQAVGADKAEGCSCYTQFNGSKVCVHIPVRWGEEAPGQ